MTGINITNKKTQKGRNKVAHVARKLMMPPDNYEEYGEKLGELKGDGIQKVKTYGIRIRHGNKIVKTIYEPPKEEHPQNGNFPAPKYLNRRFKDEGKKGKWV